MPGRSRHVYFEDEIRRPEAGRTRGQSSRRRSLSTDRVHTVFDDLTAMQGRERIVGRDAYDQLLRENQFLRIEQRERSALIAELQQQNRDLQQQNRELRRAPSEPSDAEGAAARKDTASSSKLASLRKKYDRLQADYEQIKAKAADWKAKATDYRKLSDDLNTALAESRRREEDTLRRLERVRKNFDLKQDANQQLEQEVSELTSALDLERLRRRHF